jgi:hypothetical protein
MGSGYLLALLVATVAGVGAGRGELAELVADHVLVDEHRHELAAVVDGEGEVTISGVMVERRDQVLITRLFGLLSLNAAAIFLNRNASTYGPFLMLRGMTLSSNYLVRRRTMFLSVRLLWRVL